jgi:hypothetical protein
MQLSPSLLPPSFTILVIIRIFHFTCSALHLSALTPTEQKKSVSQWKNKFYLKLVSLSQQTYQSVLCR